MKYKYYYFSLENTCILSLDGQNNSSVDLLKRSNINLIIYIDNKNIENLSSFFKNAVMQAIIMEDYSILVDDSEIRTCPFYDDTSFSELLALINDSVQICNESLSKIKNALNQ